MSPLEPIALIYEREGLPRYELPLELHGLYGGDFGLPERSVYANFVSTIDGVVAIPALRRSNRLISDDSEPDRFVVGLLRACADVVLVGSGTLRGSPNARWQAQEAFPPAASSFAELRRLLGRAGGPEVAIVTASGAIDPAHPALRESALVLTTARGATTLEGQLADTSQLVVLPGSDRVEARAVVDFLRSRGLATPRRALDSRAQPRAGRGREPPSLSPTRRAAPVHSPARQPPLPPLPARARELTRKRTAEGEGPSIRVTAGTTACAGLQ